MAFIILNKFDKEKRVIELHLAGKTIRDIAKEVHMSFRDISKIIKSYDKKLRLQQQNKKEEQENNQQTNTKKESLSTRAFKFFKEGKKPTDVAIELNLPFKQVKKIWFQFLNLERMEECYELYNGFRYEIPKLLSISNYMKRNNISGNNIVNVLRIANNIFNLNQTYSNLKLEVNSLEQKKINLSYYSPSRYSLQPLPLNKPNYHY
jgi:transposase